MKKLIKTILIGVIGVVILISPQRADAFNIWKFIGDILDGIPLPEEIYISEDGYLAVGDWKIKRVSDKHPFNKENFFEAESQVDTTDEKGFPLLVAPYIPEKCELRIITPEEAEKMSREERYALARACGEFISIQRAASNIAYFAKKMFNKTDPLTECSFLKNCRSHCPFTLGQVTYTVNILTIADWLAPTGIANFLRKVANIAKQLNELKKVYDQILSTVNYAIDFIDDLFAQVQYFKTFVDSLGKVIKTIGQEGELGFSEYGENLSRYSQAKSEALSAAGDIKGETEKMMKTLQRVEWISFLYETEGSSSQGDKEKREKLDQAIQLFLAHFESPSGFAKRLRSATKFIISEEATDAHNEPTDFECQKTGFSCQTTGSAGMEGDCLYYIENNLLKINCSGSSSYNISCSEENLVYTITKPSAPNYSCVVDCADFPMKGDIKWWEPHFEESASCKELPRELKVSCESECGAKIEKNPNQCKIARVGTTNSYQLSCGGAPSGGGGTCAIPLPKTAEEYNMSCPQVKGVVAVSCENEYTCNYSCAIPNNPQENWLASFKAGADSIFGLINALNSFEKFSVWKAGMPMSNEELLRKLAFFWFHKRNWDQNSQTDKNFWFNDNFFNIFNSFQEFLAQTKNLPIDDEGKKIFWREEEGETVAPTTEEAKEIAGENCQFDSELFYQDWNQKRDFMEISLPELNFLREMGGILAWEYINPDFSVSNLGDLTWSKAKIAHPILNYFINSPLSVQKINKYQNDIKKLSNPSSNILKLKNDKLEKIKEIIREIVNIWERGEDINAYEYIKLLLATKEKSQELYSAIQAARRLANQTEENLADDIDKFLANLGEATGPYNCPASPNGFLERIRCFEIDNFNKDFRELERITKSIFSLEKLSEKISEVAKKTKELNPSLDIPEVKITKMDDIFAGNAGMEEAGIEGEGFDKFMESPVSFLDEKYSAINSLFNGYFNLENKEYGLKAGFSSLLNLSENPDYYFLKEKTNGKTVQEKLEKTRQNDIPYLEAKILGNNKMAVSCQAIDPVLMSSNPGETLQKCNEEIYPEYNKRSKKLDEELCSRVEALERTLVEAERRVKELDKNNNLRWAGERLLPFLTENEGLGERIRGICDPEAPYHLEQGEDPVHFWSSKVCDGAVSEGNMTYMGGSERSFYSACTQRADYLSDVCPFEEEEIMELKESCEGWTGLAGAKEQCDKIVAVKEAWKENCLHSQDPSLCKDIALHLEHIRGEGLGWGDNWRQEKDIFSGDEESAASLERLKFFCNLENTNIRQPLNRVMSIYSILLGIRSYSLFMGGIETSISDAKTAYENAQILIKMLKELPEKLSEGAKKDEDSEGLSFQPLDCVALPASGSNDITTPRGGPVCPDVGNLFSIIESNFSVLRSNLTQIDIIRRGVKDFDIKIGALKLRDIFNIYPVKYNSIKSLKDEGEKIKRKAQAVWALATAVHFASQNCLCGQSLCKYPFCISNMPLTVEPLSSPYCYLVYILRHPMKKMAQNLEDKISPPERQDANEEIITYTGALTCEIIEEDSTIPGNCQTKIEKGELAINCSKKSYSVKCDKEEGERATYTISSLPYFCSLDCERWNYREWIDIQTKCPEAPSGLEVFCEENVCEVNYSGQNYSLDVNFYTKNYQLEGKESSCQIELPGVKDLEGQGEKSFALTCEDANIDGFVKVKCAKR